jgi:hypothetical protein
VGRGHPHVHHHDVGPHGRDGTDQGVTVADRGQHLVSLVPEQLHQALAQEGRVLGHDHSHGSSARTTVGPPAGLRNEKVPSEAATRPASPVKPRPRGSARRGRRRSITATLLLPGATEMPIRRTPECLTALLTASEMTK